MNEKEKENVNKSMLEFYKVPSENCSTCGCKLSKKEQKDNFHYCDDCIAEHKAWSQVMEKINDDICPNPSTDPDFW